MPETIEQSGVRVEVVEPGSPNDPFAPKNQAGSSGEVPQGTPQEPAGSTGEGTQAPEPTTATPAAQPQEATGGQPAQATRPPVVVVEPIQQPTTAQQPAPTPAPVEPEATPEDEAAALQRLDTFLKEQQQGTIDEVSRKLQSGYDRRASAMEKQLEASQQQVSSLVQETREFRTKDLSDEERAEVMKKFAQDDKEGQLRTWEGQLTDFHKSTMIYSLMEGPKNFAQYGVTQEELEKLETPEEMEALCFERKAMALEKQMAEGQTAPTPAPAAAPAPATPVPAQPEPQVPAGASAPSDVGSTGAAAPEKGFSQEQSASAMEKNLRDMGWQAVRINR